MTDKADTLFTSAFDAQDADLDAAWHLDGPGKLWIDNNRYLNLQETGSDGITLWLKQDFPADVRLTFSLSFSNNRGIGVFFVAAQGLEGEDILTDQPERTGQYAEYVKGNIRCYGFSLHRFFPDGAHNAGSNLRKNPGFHLMNHVEPDPIMDAEHAYKITIAKTATRLRLSVDDALIHDWTDEGKHGPPLQAGKIGFRLRADASCIMRLRSVRASARDSPLAAPGAGRDHLPPPPSTFRKAEAKQDVGPLADPAAKGPTAC